MSQSPACTHLGFQQDAISKESNLKELGLTQCEGAVFNLQCLVDKISSNQAFALLKVTHGSSCQWTKIKLCETSCDLILQSFTLSTVFSLLTSLLCSHILVIPGTFQTYFSLCLITLLLPQNPIPPWLAYSLTLNPWSGVILSVGLTLLFLPLVINFLSLPAVPILCTLFHFSQ